MPIIHTKEYKYIGSLVNNKPHGRGRFEYIQTNNVYTGDCKLGQADGFGSYITSYETYTGFYSLGKRHGLGTLESQYEISKGPWRLNKRHGKFLFTDKVLQVTLEKYYEDNILQSSKKVQYYPAEQLQTTKRKSKNILSKYHGQKNLCNICYSTPIGATNTACGHVACCYNCLSQVSKCPYCRKPIEKIIRLYIV